MILLALALVSCTGAANPAGKGGPPSGPEEDLQAYQHIRRLLARDGHRLSYDDLTEISTAMAGARRPIARMHDLLARMIGQRNPHPRVDQMILIYAARSIGKSSFFIPRAGELFHSIVEQSDRLNEWVLAFVAEGIELYPFDIRHGHALMDRVEAQLAVVRSKAGNEAEMFGFHFLPPPRNALIRSYLDGIEDRRRREQERHRYYFLIRQNITEDDIALSLSNLQSRQRSGSGPPCPWLMECLAQMTDRIPLP